MTLKKFELIEAIYQGGHKFVKKDEQISDKAHVAFTTLVPDQILGVQASFGSKTKDGT